MYMTLFALTLVTLSVYQQDLMMRLPHNHTHLSCEVWFILQVNLF